MTANPDRACLGDDAEHLKIPFPALLLLSSKLILLSRANKTHCEVLIISCSSLNIQHWLFLQLSAKLNIFPEVRGTD